MRAVWPGVSGAQLFILRALKAADGAHLRAIMVSVNDTNFDASGVVRFAHAKCETVASRCACHTLEHAGVDDDDLMVVVVAGIHVHLRIPVDWLRLPPLGPAIPSLRPTSPERTCSARHRRCAVRPLRPGMGGDVIWVTLIIWIIRIFWFGAGFWPR